MTVLGNAIRRLGLAQWVDRGVTVIRKLGLAGPVEYTTQIAYGLRHPSLFRSGATAREERMQLPGDRFVPEPMWMATRAITIEAPPENVWPWVVQLGHGRGGWYTWEVWWEERATSTGRVLPEFQHLRVGDVLLDSPDTDQTQGAFKVRSIRPGHHLVLYSARDPISGREVDLKTGRPGRYIEVGWAFVLRAVGEDQTRLLVRVRATYAPRWATVAFRLLGAGDTVWHGTLLRGIKERAEKARERMGPPAAKAVTRVAPFLSAGWGALVGPPARAARASRVPLWRSGDQGSGSGEAPQPGSRVGPDPGSEVPRPGPESVPSRRMAPREGAGRLSVLSPGGRMLR